MRQGKDEKSRRRFLLAQLENYRTDRQECSPIQREEFDVRIRSCIAQLSQLENAGHDEVVEPIEAPVIPSFE